MLLCGLGETGHTREHLQRDIQKWVHSTIRAAGRSLCQKRDIMPNWT